MCDTTTELILPCPDEQIKPKKMRGNGLPNLLRRLAFVGLAAALPACSVLQGATELVTIEYDQALNFNSFAFQAAVHPMGPGGSQEWESMQTNPTAADGKTGRQRVWISYVICKIDNAAPKAKPFNFDIDKFYLQTSGANNTGTIKHPFKKIYDNTTYTSGPIGQTGLVELPPQIAAQEFRLENQTAPDTLVMPPGSLSTQFWRFAILVDMPFFPNTPSADLLHLDLPLFYDGNPVLMVSRNRPTQPGSDFVQVDKSSLPTACRIAPL